MTKFISENRQNTQGKGGKLGKRNGGESIEICYVSGCSVSGEYGNESGDIVADRILLQTENSVVAVFFGSLYGQCFSGVAAMAAASFK